jgi:hypothetical protein
LTALARARSGKAIGALLQEDIAIRSERDIPNYIPFISTNQRATILSLRKYCEKNCIDLINQIIARLLTSTRIAHPNE